jgi:hypothetical protein
MQLTEHFSDAELGVDNGDPQLAAAAHFICVKLLEPIRAKFGPIFVHDGYRDPGHNARVGGKPASYHLFVDGHAAADISAAGVTNDELFDWIRLDSGLPFDKVILEHNAQGVSACVHVQISAAAAPRRLAYIGMTGDGQVYTPVLVK